jgi:hypothetical protein
MTGEQSAQRAVLLAHYRNDGFTLQERISRGNSSTKHGNINEYLVGGLPTPLKNMKVSWDHDIPN